MGLKLVDDSGTERPRPAVDTRHLRRCLAQFATGVTVVSYLVGGQPRGITVNSFTSVSMAPPIVLVSIATRAKAAPVLIDSPFTVNVLGAEQLNIARAFAGQPANGTGPKWVRREGKTPRLRGVAAWFRCEPWSSVEAGDHVLVLGRVVEYEERRVSPLVFHQGQFRSVGPALDGPGIDPSTPLSAIRWLHRKAQAAGLTDEGVDGDTRL